MVPLERLGPVTNAELTGGLTSIVISKRLRSIFVGVNNRGGHIINLFSRYPDHFCPAGFVDQTADIARAKAAELDLEDVVATSRLEDAIERTEADACIITSPARFHGEQIRMALDAGLHVFVAKPMTYNLDEAVELVEVAERHALCLVVDQQQQHLETERKLRQLVADQTYGAVGHIAFNIHRCRPQMGSFTGPDPFIWEQGVHSFNSLIAILDLEAISVTACQANPPWTAYNGPTTAMGVIEFAGGIPCSYVGTFESRNHVMEIRIDFERAAVRAIAQNTWHKRLEIAPPGRNFEETGIQDGETSKPAECTNIEAFYRGVTTGVRVVNDGRDNLRTLALIDAFIRSAKSGRKEKVRRFD